MAGLPPFIPIPGAPGLGLPFPKLGQPQAAPGADFGSMFDEAQRKRAELPMAPVEKPAKSLFAAPVAPAQPAAPTAISELGKPLGAFLESVNAEQIHADSLKNELATGGDVELHDVMIAAEKAGISVELTMQLRNKLLDAYQEIMRMSV
ncbi:MAG TPA: flagellar hook-basal body complex protein FliE [Pantanalinema sp.]